MNLKKLGGCKPKPAVYRFNMSYKKDEKTCCWIWQGKSRSGASKLYGRIKVDGKSMPAHRFSWEIHNEQKTPSGMFVLHRCDNPECVNPDHLFLGTHQDNMDDKVSKNRQAKGDSFKNRKPAFGSKNGLSKLTDQKAMQIFLDDRPQRKIAADYGITQASVFYIKSKRTWRHIHG
jgi:hypothetical protein